jgi:hypothetical protein
LGGNSFNLVAHSRAKFSANASFLSAGIGQALVAISSSTMIGKATQQRLRLLAPSRRPLLAERVEIRTGCGEIDEFIEPLVVVDGFQLGFDVGDSDSEASHEESDDIFLSRFAQKSLEHRGFDHGLASSQ